MNTLSSDRLKQKLHKLRQQKQQRLRCSLWRSAIVISCTTGLLALGSLPQYQVKHKLQINIEGEKLITEDTLHSWLNFSYPQYIWLIPSQILAQKLESIPSIAAAKVTKQMFPPQLSIAIRERIPVAIAVSNGRIGFLDRKGIWIPQEYYGDLSSKSNLPDLKVINFPPQEQNFWQEIYRLTSLYTTVKVTEITWDKTNALFLKTSIGKVYLGSDRTQLAKQFKIMASLIDLPAHFERSEIAYIDLSNPDLNLIQKYQQ